MAKKSKRGSGVLAGLAFGVAAGIAAGTYILAPNLPDGPVQREHSSMKELTQAKTDAAIADAQAKTADAYIGSVAEKTVEGVLKDRPVLVLTTSDADPEDVKNVEWLLKKAGAQDAGTIKLEDKFFAQDGADSLKTIVTNTLPAGAQLSTTKLDPGTHAGEALGSALMMNKDGKEQSATQERALLLGALKDSGYLSYEEGTIRPGQVAILITGDSDGTAGGEFVALQQSNFAQALDSRSSGVVVAGRVRTSATTGVIGRLRATQGIGVSTVDSVDRSFGRLATVLAGREQLAGRTGHYGTAESAEAAAPARPE